MSSKSTHTKGPWEWNAGGIDSADLGIIAESGQMVAMVVVDEDYPQELPEQEANARLIAAAPDLFAVCRAMESAWERPHTVKDADSLRGQLRAAITKAEGGAA